MIQCTEYYNRAFAFVFGALSHICLVSDLHWGLALYLLKVAFGHLFFNQPLDGALCSGWVYVPNLKLRVYNSVRNITIEDLICIGASSGIFYKICIGALSCIC